MMKSGQQLEVNLSHLLTIIVIICQTLTINGQLERIGKVCYEKFGCFKWTKFIHFTPESPEKVGTVFKVFTPSGDNNCTINYNNDDNYELFDNSTRVVFVVHGWLDHGQRSWYRPLFGPLLTKYDLLVSVDWQKGADDRLYVQSVANVQLVGRQMAYLINRLKIKRQLRPENVHLIGFSLGAHVTGQAGRWAKEEYGFTIGRITGLDAARPLIAGTVIHVMKTDAEYVDAIHTSAGRFADLLIGRLGTKDPYGHKDFYPNGGSNQPFCPFAWENYNCHHFAAIKFFTYSIDTCGFVATKCDSWDNFKSGQCDTAIKANMGFKSNQTKDEGSFYLRTAEEEPYC